MSLKVNSELSALENVYALLKHSAVANKELVTDEHISVSTPTLKAGKMKITITGISDAVTGTKDVSYTATDLAAVISDVTVDESGEAATLVAQQVAALPCLSSEVVVGDLVDNDGVLSISVAAVAGAYTVYGQKVVTVTVNVPEPEPEAVGDIIEGDELDGFDQD